jgi:uncharacterized membrane protein YuzA (DUF378 family)
MNQMTMNQIGSVNAVALVLTIVGGVNWLMVGLANFNLVALIFGNQTVAARVVYVIVGICALYCLSLVRRVAQEPARLGVSYAGDKPSLR